VKEDDDSCVQNAMKTIFVCDSCGKEKIIKIDRKKRGNAAILGKLSCQCGGTSKLIRIEQ